MAKKAYKVCSLSLDGVLIIQYGLIAYNRAVQMCENDSSLKSSVFTAIAMTHYSIGEKSKCKTFLFSA